MKFDMKNAKLTFILMSSSIKLDDKISQILNQQDHKLYCKMMRKLMFALIVIWIDIITAVNRLSQYLSASQIIHLQAAKHVLQYLCGLSQLEILYKSTDSNLVEYANTVYVNARQFQFTTGFCFLIGGAPVSWTSK